jgi:hypothetical protein
MAQLNNHDLAVLRRAASGVSGYQAISDRWTLAILDRLAAAERIAMIAHAVAPEGQPDLLTAVIEWRKVSGYRGERRNKEQPTLFPPKFDDLQTDSFC